MQSLNKLAINENGFTFDPATGESYRLNETALDVIRQLKRGLSEEDVASEMSKEYDISFPEALADVLEFLVQLRIQGIIS